MGKPNRHRKPKHPDSKWWLVPAWSEATCTRCSRTIPAGDAAAYEHGKRQLLCAVCVERTGIAFKPSRAWRERKRRPLQMSLWKTDRERIAAVEAAPRRREREAQRAQALAALPSTAYPNGRKDITRPTATQLHDLVVLAKRTGEPTPSVTHRGEAVRELQRLKAKGAA